MKGLILTLSSCVVIVLVLNTGYYSQWFREKPQAYWSDFLKEKDDTAGETSIKTARYGITYTISMKVKEAVTKKNMPHAIILFEPNSYYRDSLHISIRAPEPAVFYYYTGLVGVWTNSPDVNRANFIVRVSKKGVVLDAIRSPQQLQQILASYKKFIPTL